jgi:hypothetical protein
MVCSSMILVLGQFSNAPSEWDGRFTLHPGTPPAGVRQAYYENLHGNAGALLADQGFGWRMEAAIHVLRDTADVAYTAG